MHAGPCTLTTAWAPAQSIPGYILPKLSTWSELPANTSPTTAAKSPSLPPPSFPSHVFGFSTFVPNWISCHTEGVSLSSSSLSFLKWTPIWWQKWDTGMVFFYVFLLQSSQGTSTSQWPKCWRTKTRRVPIWTYQIKDKKTKLEQVKENGKKRKAKPSTSTLERDLTEREESLQCNIDAYSRSPMTHRLCSPWLYTGGLWWHAVAATGFFLRDIGSFWENNN